MNPRVQLAVFTRDLRVADNPMLAQAATAERVVPLFVQDPAITGGRFSNPSRQHLLNAGLADLDHSLRGIGGALVVRRGDPITEIVRLAERVDAEAVHIAADVSSHAQHREQRLAAALAGHRRGLVVHEAVTTVQPAGSITPSGSDHFAVFTPYLRRWLQQPRRDPLPPPRAIRLPDGLPSGRVPSGQQARGWTGGETAARQRVEDWFTDGLDDYHDRHDDLAGDATSKLSPSLHFGFVSPLELVTRAQRHAGPGPEAFVRQLAWRDFHHQVLAARPQAAWQDYRPRGDHWIDDDAAFRAWQAGLTGYPLVDAGMRQLTKSGWMHNRARMIVASFLTKTLYLDWRLGAQHFLDQLVDGDLANNNLNWQWVAGTGNDTRPNRVLNPLRQAKRFDADADYVRRWLPELAAIDDPTMAHQPWLLPAADRRTLRYPEPIIDLTVGRDRFAHGRG
ncbi:cryptochrome/photolyase family protein [Microlunatus soli]|uniref:Deoxyribodipyrimidine photo-lyase n=1 Tax=Microlunatus soli TaxID=630515 RepID=A0A1H1N1K4_9ACTN|nr:deoxyribodipyrimidine photo-lyase [Microlunatus soli]SDR92874.1 deoxyribodipyrimidine photo-lyase [Microlunatus soli]